MPLQQMPLMLQALLLHQVLQQAALALLLVVDKKSKRCWQQRWQMGI